MCLWQLTKLLGNQRNGNMCNRPENPHASLGSGRMLSPPNSGSLLEAVEFNVGEEKEKEKE